VLPLFFLATPLTADAQARTRNAAPRFDQFGDPLPEHALLRIGTTRLRTSSLVTKLTFTSDGKRLVSLTETAGGKTWDVQSGKELVAFGLLANNHAPSTVAADGSLAAFVESDKKCHLYDTGSAREVRVITGPFANARALALSPDKKQLASSDVYGVVHLWDVASGDMLRVWSNGEKSNYGLVSMAFSPDGKTLAVGTRYLNLWDVSTGALMLAPEWDCENVSFSPDGKIVIAMRQQGDFIMCYSAATGELINAFVCGGHLSPGFSCCGIMADGKTIVAGIGLTVFAWDVKADHFALGRQIPCLSDVTSIATDANGNRVATAHLDGTLKIWDFKTGKPIHEFAGRDLLTIKGQFTNDGKMLTIATVFPGDFGYKDPHVSFWDLSGKLVKQTLIAFSLPYANTSQTEVVYSSGKLTVRDLLADKWSVREYAMVVDQSVERLQISPDGRLVVFAGTRLQKPSFQVWDLAERKSLLVATGDELERHFSRLTADCRYLVTIARKPGNNKEQVYQLCFWDIRTGQRVLRPTPYFHDTRRPTRVLSPDGRLMALDLDEREADTVPVWEVATGKRVVELAGEKARICCMAFSPNSAIIATGTNANQVLLWNLHSNKPIARLDGHCGRIGWLGFSPDGKQLVTGSDDTTMLVWDASPWTDPNARAALALGESVNSSWNALAHDDPSIAYPGIGKFMGSPAETVAYFRKQMQPIQPAHTKEIAALVAALDSSKFAEREQATAKLKNLGFQAVSSLEKSLAADPTLEVRQRVKHILSKLEGQPLRGELLQSLRALAVLEMLGTKDATVLLESLAAGEPDAWLTQEAAATLERVRKRMAQIQQ
ncbi:MAG TPA: WD40 repeat domain-containing protein, partial [Gemmataceae bacterium]|nr:WD40 repeat domain-containing protein [Gemmataceae bacterium]